MLLYSLLFCDPHKPLLASDNQLLMMVDFAVDDRKAAQTVGQASWSSPNPVVHIVHVQLHCPVQPDSSVRVLQHVCFMAIASLLHFLAKPLVRKTTNDSV